MYVVMFFIDFYRLRGEKVLFFITFSSCLGYVTYAITHNAL